MNQPASSKEADNNEASISNTNNDDKTEQERFELESKNSQIDSSDEKIVIDQTSNENQETSSVQTNVDEQNQQTNG